MDQLIFKKRRKEFIRRIQESGGGVVVLVAGNETTRNGDVEHEFRQESNFYYLTGLEQADAIAVFNPESKKPYTLFVAARDPKKELWVGPSVGPVEAVKYYGADQAFDIVSLREIPRRGTDLLSASATIWYHFGNSDQQLFEKILNELRQNPRSGRRTPDTIRDPFPVIAEMRLIKSKEEIASLQKAIDMTAHGLRACLTTLKPGLKEYQLRAEFEHAIRWRGVTRHAYPPIIASGSGTCVLHNPHDRITIKNDSLVLIDAGAEWDYYAADITRTVPASGHFTKEQRTVYDIVLDAQERTIAMVKPGAMWDQLENTAREFMTKALLKKKILFPESRKAGSRGEEWFPHKLGHWLGMDVHDVGSRVRPDNFQFLPLRGISRRETISNFQKRQTKNRTSQIQNTNYPATAGPRLGGGQVLDHPFAPGMVLTIEPGIYLNKSKDIAPEYWGIGIRIEDDILVTRSGFQNLSEKIPKKADVLERMIQKTQK